MKKRQRPNRTPPAASLKGPIVPGGQVVPVGVMHLAQIMDSNSRAIEGLTLVNASIREMIVAAQAGRPGGPPKPPDATKDTPGT